LRRFPFKRRVLVVGEGRETEYNYFIGFRKAFEKELEATATSISVKRGNGGDARGIVQNAIKEAKNFEPDRKRGDRVFLVMDTEGPGAVPGGGRAPELPAAERLAMDSGIEIVYSSPAIEFWLLCHFQKISRGAFKNCEAVCDELNKEKYWKTLCNSQYDKADQDVFDRLSDYFSFARAQSLEIDLHHLRTTCAARKTNPSTQVYELIAILIGSQSGEKCPIEGTWKLIGDDSVEMKCKKGGKMPNHSDKAAHWKLATS